MSGLGKRVERLEGGGSAEVTVVAVVPENWPGERQRAEVRAAAVAHGAVEPFKLWIIPSADVDGVELQWIGDVGDMLDRIGREGRRITA